MKETLSQTLPFKAENGWQKKIEKHQQMVLWVTFSVGHRTKYWLIHNIYAILVLIYRFLTCYPNQTDRQTLLLFSKLTFIDIMLWLLTKENVVSMLVLGSYDFQTHLNKRNEAWVIFFVVNSWAVEDNLPIWFGLRFCQMWFELQIFWRLALVAFVLF